MITDISAIELETGMKFDSENDCFTGVFSGFTFVLNVYEKCYSLTTWAAEQGFDGAENINSFLDAFMLRELSPLTNYRHENNTVILVTDNHNEQRDYKELSSLVHHFSVFLSANYCKSCCFDCGGGGKLSLVSYGGKMCQLCGNCIHKYIDTNITPEAGYVIDEKLARDEYGYNSPRNIDIDITAPQHSLFEIRQELEKPSNLLFGITGALAFTLLAAVIWALIGQTRFIPIIQPIILGYLCAKGYRVCAGVLDTRGIVSCSVIIAAAVPICAFLSTFLSVYSEIDGFGGTHSVALTLKWLEYYMTTSVYVNTLSVEIGIGYLLTAAFFAFYCKLRYMVTKN